MKLQSNFSHTLKIIDFVSEILIFFGALYFAIYWGFTMNQTSLLNFFLLLCLVLLAHIATFWFPRNYAFLIAMAAKGLCIIYSFFLLFLYILQLIGISFLRAFASLFSEIENNIIPFRTALIVFILFIVFLSRIGFLIVDVRNEHH